MDYRHEWKIEINEADHIALRSRLRAIMDVDPHAVDGRYLVRSLYFDSPGDRALMEKRDGLDRREKFRIRYYNGDTSYMELEKKSKVNGLCRKLSCKLTAAEAQSIIDGDTSWMAEGGSPLIEELYVKMKSEGLRPKTVVDYVREPFIFDAGNVRVTFDYSIRTGLRDTDFLNADLVTVPAGDAPILMEVKWDAFLPDIIRDAVNISGRRPAAFSKYAQCRIYEGV